MHKVSDKTGVPVEDVCFFFDDFCLYVKNTLRSVPMKCVQLKPFGYIAVPEYNMDRKLCRIVEQYREGKMHINEFYYRSKVVAEQKVFRQKIKNQKRKR